MQADQWWRIGYLRTFAGHNSEPNEHLENILPLLGPTLIHLGQHLGKQFFTVAGCELIMTLRSSLLEL